MTDEETTEKPKLIIDDDWKERVQSEKEAAAAAKAGAAKENTSDAEKSADAATQDTSSHVAGEGDQPQAERELPPASFATLVHSLTAQALASLGQIPDAEGNTNVQIDMGKHFIDTLSVLEEKTKGNLDDDESAALGKMLYELRMLFVHVRKEQQNSTTGTGGKDADG